MGNSADILITGYPGSSELNIAGGSLVMWYWPPNCAFLSFTELFGSFCNTVEFGRISL